MENKSVNVIGPGFAGLTAAALLSKQGYNVTLLKKNAQPAGRFFAKVVVIIVMAMFLL